MLLENKFNESLKQIIMKLKNFEVYDFDGIKINGVSYEVIERNEHKKYICELIDDDVIYKTQNYDYDECVSSLKELYSITKNIKNFNVIHLYN
jgi:hypothetical protein